MLSDVSKTKIARQIEDLAELLGLSEYVIEKDLYLTHAIGAVTQVSHDLFDLVFQGGTSLAKAHRLIERMSEDCDFRIRIVNPEAVRTKERTRQALREFRYALIDALRQAGFSVDKNAIIVRKE